MNIILDDEEVLQDTEAKSEDTNIEYLLSQIGESIGLTIRAVLDEAKRETSSNEIKEFFNMLGTSANEAATAFDTSVNGQIDSANAAFSFFEENIHKFPGISRKYALDTLELIESIVQSQEELGV